MSSPSGKPHQITVADNLWDIFLSIADDSGNKIDSLVGQAMFEMAVKLGYIAPAPQESQPPLGDAEMPGPRASAVSGAKFAPGRTKDSPGRPPLSPPPPSPPAKRPPRPAPRPGASTSTPGAAPISIPPAAPSAAKAEGKGLFIVNEDGDTEKIDKDIYIIGRSSKCDLVINSVKVSREHAIITRERGEFFIEDLGSANGTWYKGERIEKMKIKDGDEIFICDEKYKFVVR